MISKKALVLCCVVGAGLSTMSIGIAPVEPFATHGLLIFLDDVEDYIGSLSGSFLAAFVQEAGPIIASASLIVNVRDAQTPSEADPKKLFERFKEIISKLSSATKEILEEEKKIILSVTKFGERATDNWVIKEINANLYLLLPKYYLNSRGIQEVDAHLFSPQAALTLTEQLLGLKVNHMKTVDVAAIKKPQPRPVKDYFVQDLSNIFITKRDYKAEKNSSIPTWAVYSKGHGLMNRFIVSLSLDHFKAFLTFLEDNLLTKLLLYDSCYAAGINAEILYKDAEKAINKTYSFAIVTSAITDAVSFSYHISLIVDRNGELQPYAFEKFDEFLDYATSVPLVNFKQLVSLILNVTHNIPQIKFPGLPWFSALDNDKVISIGSILAKTRTKPLNLAHFFKKENADVRGILFYAHDIPFELIVTIKNPRFISMIPGNAIHHIKKISGTGSSISAVELIHGFFIQELEVHKTFIIEELSGGIGGLGAPLDRVLGTNTGILHNLIIDLTPLKNTIYFTYNNEVYYAVGMIFEKNLPLKAPKEVENIYNKLLHQSRITQQALVQEFGVEKRSVHECLTPENIEKIRDAQKNSAQVRLTYMGKQLHELKMKLYQLQKMLA